MKALIYQFWEGPKMSIGNQAGTELMAEYAEKIGVEYQFERNPSWPENARVQRQNLGPYNPHYGAFKPIFDPAYNNYDYILFCDTDIIPITHSRLNPRKNIFAEFMGLRHQQIESKQSLTDLWISEEWMQPQLRVEHNMGGINNQNDIKWSHIVESAYGSKILTDERGRPRVFNSGVVLYSAQGRLYAQKNFVDFKLYCNLMRSRSLPPFYQGDQNYLNAMMTAGMNWSIMPYKWNSQMFFKPGTTGDNRPVSDYRLKDTQFVHLQQRGADNWDKERIVETANGL